MKKPILLKCLLLAILLACVFFIYHFELMETGVLLSSAAVVSILLLMIPSFQRRIPVSKRDFFMEMMIVAIGLLFSCGVFIYEAMKPDIMDRRLAIAFVLLFIVVLICQARLWRRRYVEKEWERDTRGC